MWKPTSIALAYQSTYSSGGKDEPTPWGLLAFLGLGFILFLVIQSWWYSRPSSVSIPYQKESDAGEVKSKLAWLIFFAVFVIIIVTLRKQFEVLWGETIANTISIIGELIGIAGFVFLEWRNKS